MQAAKIAPWLLPAAIPAVAAAVWFFGTSAERKLERDRQAILKEDCPGLTSFEDCIREQQAKIREQQAKAEAARDQAARDYERAVAVDLARRKSLQNGDPKEIDAVLSRVLDGAKKIRTLHPRCGAQLKGQTMWDERDRGIAADLDQTLRVEVVGDMLPRQKRTFDDLLEALAGASACGRCSEESKAACARMRSALERAENHISAK
ncbi:MAG: hypothetical protein HOO96_18135 [Polyangiaceae bacterium]|nr:hypothetical protein [Polyangiaceae bacterium]